MHRKLIFAFLIVILLAACGPASTPVTGPPAAVTPAEASIRLVDGLGRTVSLPAPAERVVSLAPSNTEILYAVGAGDQVIGRDLFSDYPAAALEVQDIGGSMGEYDLEAIAALQPGLVLAGGINPPELVAALEGLGLNVYFLPNPVTLEEMYANLETVAALPGRPRWSSRSKLAPRPWMPPSPRKSTSRPSITSWTPATRPILTPPAPARSWTC
jgi:iron complex transport system substrate-binding protein